MRYKSFSISEDSHVLLIEMGLSSGMTHSELVDIAIMTLGRSGAPEPVRALQRFKAELYKRKSSMERFCKTYKLNSRAIHYYCQSVDEGRKIGAEGVGPVQRHREKVRGTEFATRNEYVKWCVNDYFGGGI